MKHAVILAHPKPNSFCGAIARTCVDHLRASNHDVVLRDLYALNFDPRLRAEEMPTAYGATPAADVAAERALLADARSLIFVYPFWFNAPPAILKGYVDRVLGMGFGYASVSGHMEPLLDGVTLASFSTSGAPEHWVNSTGALKALMTVFDLHLCGVCGLRLLGHEHFGGVVPNMTEEWGSDLLEQVRAKLDDLFELVSA
ncbi:NAD(P)H-dependent oxidoreductase [Caulobacter sp.]|uniref:NAD(P)H-dependent oxidoreductase n=1 Tax=Caulobacter sp. TaxID=78 RepID=UPI002B487A8A|nr:NAD(P)H-dependent oxidoreductase [Caulobacter sp.]HJV43082.1 NAD(P)H-dependent oxidoreductase [Caulobacter sp.]